MTSSERTTKRSARIHESKIDSASHTPRTVRFLTLFKPQTLHANLLLLLAITGEPYHPWRHSIRLEAASAATGPIVPKQHMIRLLHKQHARIRVAARVHRLSKPSAQSSADSD